MFPRIGQPAPPPSQLVVDKIADEPRVAPETRRSVTRHLIRSRGEKPEGQKLLVARVKDRSAVIFSEFDLVASGAGIANYKALAYKPESARKILGNVITYLTLD